MNHINNKTRILTLIREAEEQFAGTGKALLDIEDYVAEYLTANGVIAPPCKVGDVVYVVFYKHKFVEENRVIGFIIGRNNDTLQFEGGSIYTIWDKAYNEHFGKTVFLSREEAEAALKGGTE